MKIEIFIKNQILTITSAITILVLGVAFGWMIAHSSFGVLWHAKEGTQRNLKDAKEVIRTFIKEWRDVPTSLAELRAYAKNADAPFSSFDAYGQRFDYIRLSRRHFVMRSFGRDGRQNNLNSSPDPSISIWNNLPETTPLYRYLTNFRLTLYPSPLILGSLSPNLKWHAQIYTDPVSNTRRLMVRNLANDKFFLLAPHDFVEEFLWMPQSDQIVFTATSSIRYQDGVYLWDLNKDETQDLTGNVGTLNAAVSSPGQQNFFLSLAGITIDGQSIFTYMAPRETIILSPKVFFSSSHLYQIAIDKKGGAPEITRAVPGSDARYALDSDFQLVDQLYGQKKDDQVYQEWLALTFRGELEQVISQWQHFSEKYADSTILPYCLWLLSSIYNDAYIKMNTRDGKAGQILRSYGAELAKGLAMMPTSPSYLRAFGGFIYEEMIAARALPYNISKLALAPLPPKAKK
jgi:hypothetical protein